MDLFFEIPDCVHTSFNEPTPIAEYHAVGIDEDLLEACPGCSVIRSYNFSSETMFRASENIKIRDMCMGPLGTCILVVTMNAKKVLQLTCSGVHGIRPMTFDLKTREISSSGKIVGVRYSMYSGIAVLTSSDPHQICGYNMLRNPGSLVWKYDGSVYDIPLNPAALCIPRETDVTVLANTNDIVLLRCFDGAVVKRLSLGENVQAAIFDGEDIYIKKRGNGEFIILP